MLLELIESVSKQDSIEAHLILKILLFLIETS